VKNRRASYRLVIQLGMTCLITIACVVGSRTKRVLIICNGLKDIAVMLCAPASLTLVRYSPKQASLLLACRMTKVY